MPSGFLGGGIGPRAFGGGAAAAAADWWQVAGQTCVAAYQPIGAASMAASYINLANPGTYDAAPGVAPTLGAGGWTSNGTQWLNTGVVPQGGYSIFVQFSDMETNVYKALFGAYGGAGRWIDVEQYTIPANSVVFTNGASSIVASGANIATGNYGVAGQYGYIDGVVRTTELSAWSGVNAQPLSIFAINVGTGGAANGSRIIVCTIAAIAIYSTTLSAADVAALTARMAAL